MMDLPNAKTPKYDYYQMSLMREQTRSFLEIASKDLLVLRSYSVEFVHRTAYDFLKGGAVNEALRQRSPPHFHGPDFIPEVVALCCTYNLMYSELSCGGVDFALGTMVRLSCIDKIAHKTRNALATTCESFALDHLQDAKSCRGIVTEVANTWSGGEHQVRIVMGDCMIMSMSSHRERAMDLTPYRYIRAFFRHWPHTALTMLTGDLSDSTTISHLRLRDLCSACTDIMHDCLYSGALPSDWIAQIGGLPRERSAPLMTPSKSVLSDDSPWHSICEFCKTPIPYSKDCGLKDAFLFFEKTAFESHQVLTPDLAALNPIGDLALGHSIAKSLSFELPWSILRRTHGLQALSNTSQFQQFVWTRQKLRAVRSLLTTIRKHLSRFATDKSISYFEQMQKVWMSFIYEFIEPPGKKDNKGRRGLRCDCCSKIFAYKKSVVVFLRPNRFPLFCKDCYRQAAPECDFGLQFVLTVRIGHFQSDDVTTTALHPGKDNLAAIKPVLQIIDWYTATAPAFGLGHLIPSDVSEIQKALKLIPGRRMVLEMEIATRMMDSDSD
jgi:hypothetical protein